VVRLCWRCQQCGRLRRRYGQHLRVDREGQRGRRSRPSFNIIKRIATSKRPRDMQMTRAKDLLYVACGDDDAIDVIDVVKLEVINTIPTGPSPEMFRLSDDETSVYVSDEENSTVERIDLASMVATQTIRAGQSPKAS